MGPSPGVSVGVVIFAAMAGGLLTATLAIAPALADGGTLHTNVNPVAATFQIDSANERVTLPLFRGAQNGQTVWYVVTESSSKDDARRRGVNWSPKLANALGTRAVQPVTIVSGIVNFTGGVDFGPSRVVIAGPAGNEFLGGTYQPGAVGDSNYSPLITTGNGIVLNATQVANATGVHDSVVTLDTAHGKVTFGSFFGFWNGHTTIYLHQDASSPVVAAAEGSILATNLDFAPGLGSNDPNTSARSAIIPIVNGAVGANNPQRQGLNSALRGEGDPLNVQQEVPGQGNGRYSPLWDVHPAVWTASAIATGEQHRLTSHSEVRGELSHGNIVSGGAGPANDSLDGLRAAGFISNCPIVALS
jgi:hypothetical protein